MKMKNKTDIFKMVHTSLSNGIRAGKTKDARTWLESKALSIELTGACFCSGQLHHRKEQNFINELSSIRFLIPSDAPTNTGKHGFTSFGKEAIVFALKNDKNETVNFYAIRICLDAQPTEYLNDEGIYPSYPHPLTTKLYITTSILDASTLLESRILDNRDAVISLHDGELKDQHINAIKNLTQLQQIILIKTTE